MTRTVKTWKREAEEMAEKKVNIFNPSDEDFTVNYCGNTYTIHAQELEEYLYPVAQHIKRHLADHIFNQRGRDSVGGGQLGIQATKDRIMKEIEVQI